MTWNIAGGSEEVGRRVEASPRCTSTCHVYVEEGGNLLSPAQENEEDILDKAFDVRHTSRLGCQAKIQREGTVLVRISQESLTAFFNEHPEAKPTR